MHILLASLVQFYQLPPMQAEDNEGLPFAQTVSQMLKADPDPSTLCAAADLFFEDQSPHQAAILYNQALKLNPEYEAAILGKKKVADRLNYLDQRYQEFQAHLETGGKATHICSMAAIKFHQGFTREALSLLNEAVRTFPEETDPLYLKGTFEQGVSREKELLTRLETEMASAALEGNHDEAGIKFLRMIFIGMGKERTFEAFDDIIAINPDVYNQKSLATLKALTEFYKE